MVHPVNIQDHNHQGHLDIQEVMATVMQDLRVVLPVHNLQAGHLQVAPIKEVQAAHQAIRQEAVQPTLHLQEAAQTQHTQHRPEAVQVVLRDLTQAAVEAAAEAVVMEVAVEAADAKDQRLYKIISIKINNFDHETYPDHIGGGFTVTT